MGLDFQILLKSPPLNLLAGSAPIPGTYTLSVWRAPNQTDSDVTRAVARKSSTGALHLCGGLTFKFNKNSTDL